MRGKSLYLGFISTCLALVLVAGCELPQTAEPTPSVTPPVTTATSVRPQEVTFGELASNPDKYNGKFVTFEAYIFRGWEWSFLGEGFTYEKNRIIPQGATMAISGSLPQDIDRQLYREQAPSGPPNHYGKLRVKGTFEYGKKYGMQGFLYLITIEPSGAEVLTWSPPTPTCPGIVVNISLSDSPVLDKSVQALLTATMGKECSSDAKNAAASIVLPKGFELLDGQMQWKGDIMRGTTIELKPTIKAIKAGEWQIEARVQYFPFPGNSQGDSKTLYTAVFSGRALVSDSPIRFDGDRFPLVVQATGEAHFADLALSLAKPPALGQTAELTLTATAIRDMQSARIAFDLTQGFELISGKKEWSGNLVKGDQVKLIATIKAVKTGRWYIRANSYSSAPSNVDTGSGDLLTVYIFEDGAEVVHP